MKIAMQLFTITATLVLGTGCTNKVDDQPKTQIFEGTGVITLITPLDNTALVGNFSYSVPSEVKFVVLGIFNQQITTAGKTITNPSAFVYGSRDGLSDFVRGSQAKASLHNFNQTTKDFDSGNPGSPTCTNCYWAVWGYDQYGNLSHSSPQRMVTGL